MVLYNNNFKWFIHLICYFVLNLRFVFLLFFISNFCCSYSGCISSVLIPLAFHALLHLLVYPFYRIGNRELLRVWTEWYLLLCCRSSIAVNLHTWVQVSIFRMNQFGSLAINFGVPSRGYSDGDLKELNLPMTLFLGGYAGEYNVQAGVTTGFHGAIQRVCS